MTDKLPPNLLALFAPRPALRYLQPCDFAPEKRITNRIGGVGQYMQALKEWKSNDSFPDSECWLQKKDRLKQEAKAKQAALPQKFLDECTSRFASAYWFGNQC